MEPWYRNDRPVEAATAAIGRPGSGRGVRGRTQLQLTCGVGTSWLVKELGGLEKFLGASWRDALPGCEGIARMGDADNAAEPFMLKTVPVATGAPVIPMLGILPLEG